MPSLQVIVGSTRPGRVGLPVAEWFEELAGAHEAFDVELVDLAAWDLPLLDEPAHPRLRQYVHDHTKRWSAQIDSGDAFVFVTPEYNHGFSAALKNAIDFLNQEWHYKPVGFVSYGGVSAGTRAATMLKQVVTAVKMVPVVEAVHIPFVAQFLDAEDRIASNTLMDEGAHAMLDELAKLEAALRPLRFSARTRPHA